MGHCFSTNIDSGRRSSTHNPVSSTRPTSDSRRHRNTRPTAPVMPSTSQSLTHKRYPGGNHGANYVFGNVSGDEFRKTDITLSKHQQSRRTLVGHGTTQGGLVVNNEYIPTPEAAKRMKSTISSGSSSVNLNVCHPDKGLARAFANESGRRVHSASHGKTQVKMQEHPRTGETRNERFDYSDPTATEKVYRPNNSRRR